MIFGRKRKSEPTAEELSEDSAVETEETEPEEATDSETDAEAESTTDEAEVEDADDTEIEEADEAEVEDIDWRENGPFDDSEVELEGDEVTRVSLGPLTVTPWDGLGLQLQVVEDTKAVRSITAVWKNSGLEVALFAAPASGGLAEELREDLLDEAESSGGSATLAEGPFGPEIRRVLPQEGPKGEQLFHVSRIWFAEGPRWLLRGTLLGEAAVGDAAAPIVTVFVEFFRNLVVHRGDKPMVPGELITLNLPEGAGS